MASSSKRKFPLNKYVVVLLVFAAIILFTDEYNVINRVRDRMEIRRLERELLEKKESIEHTKERIEELQSDRENLEKFAREQYFMKRATEDIYIIEEE